MHLKYLFFLIVFCASSSVFGQTEIVKANESQKINMDSIKTEIKILNDNVSALRDRINLVEDALVGAVTAQADKSASAVFVDLYIENKNLIERLNRSITAIQKFRALTLEMRSIENDTVQKVLKKYGLER